MRFLGVVGLLLIGVMACGQQDTVSGFDEMLNARYDHTVEVIHPAELYQKMQAGETIYLLDAREQKEYAVSALNGAFHVGFLFFSKKKIPAAGKDEMIVVYCTIGARSETVGERLQKNGYTNVYNLYGGIIHWKNEGFPVYKDGEKTENVHVYSKKWGEWLTNGKAKH